jgi:hypothetical protein
MRYEEKPSASKHEITNRKLYHKPILEVYGGLRSITKSVQGSHHDDGVSGTGNNHKTS